MNKNPEFKDISSSSTGRRNDFFDIDSENLDFNFNKTKQTQDNGTVSTPASPQKRQLEDFDGFIFEDIYSSDKPNRNKSRNKSENSLSLNSYSSGKKANRQLKQKITIFNILICTVLIISLLATGVMGALAYYTGDMTYAHISSNHSDLGIDKDLISTLPKGITNIALFGLDSRSKVTDNKDKALTGRSDSIIILSVNTNNNTIKMTSILRDSWVPVDGKGMQKINAAYAYGGAQLAIKTINKNYGLDITDYVSVSLHQLWKVIDFMGGIDIQITEAERKELNYLANSEGFGVNKLEKSGYVHLDGGQAMTYARIRHTDGDNIRAMRQQKVLSCLLEKAKNMSATEYPALLKSILAHVETSLDYSEIISFAPLLSGSLTLNSKNIPGDEVVAKGGIFDDSKGAWVWEYDLSEAKKFIHKWIYDIE